MEGLRQRITKGAARGRRARSSLVRRLVEANDDPAKQRIRRWLSDIDDERLLSFGLTPEDIVFLRGSRCYPRDSCVHRLVQFRTGTAIRLCDHRVRHDTHHCLPMRFWSCDTGVAHGRHRQGC